jgi:hypothetical protein
MDSNLMLENVNLKKDLKETVEIINKLRSDNAQFTTNFENVQELLLDISNCTIS